MASSKESVGQHKSHSILAFLAVLLSVVGTLYWVPLLTLSKKIPDDRSILLPVSVYAYLYLPIPLNFHLNTLLVLVHVMTDTGAAKTPFSVFLKKCLQWAAYTVSLATILLSTPLSMLVAANEESIGLAIGAALISVALATILFSCIKKIFISGGGFVPVYFALFISTGFITSHFSNQSHYEPIAIYTPTRLIVLFLSFSIFVLSTILLFEHLSTPTDNKEAVIEADNIIIVVLSLAISALLIVRYLEVYISVANMAEIIVKAGEP